MAEKLEGQYVSSTSNMKFVLVRKSDGAFWSTAGTPAFESYQAANIGNYGIAATETGSTGIYTATNPADTTEAFYRLVAAAGASLAVSDLANNVVWTGEAGPRNANTTLIEGSDATNQIAANAGGGGDALEETLQKILRVLQAQAEQ